MEQKSILQVSFRAALIFYMGTTVALHRTDLINSTDAGLLAYNVRNVTSISQIKINETRSTPGQLLGNAIVYTGCNLDNCSYTLKIHDSEFSNNKYNYTGHKYVHVSGLLVSMNKCHANITIIGSIFSNNSASDYGGNLKINLTNIIKPWEQYVHLYNVSLTKGNATGGGGLHITISLSRNDKYKPYLNLMQNPMALIENVTFYQNSAQYLGGGLYLQQKESIEETNDHTRIIIMLVNCTFTENLLTNNKRGGVAIHSNSYIIAGFETTIAPQYINILKNCSFTGNTVGGNTTTSGNSVLFINSNKHFLIESINITDNTCNAITAVNSNLILGGTTILSRNVNGSSGGGLLLCENAILYFKRNTHITISNNTVQHAGGGICVESQCLEAHPRCFYQLYNSTDALNDSNINISIHFNEAGFGGHNLFGGDIDLCYMLDYPSSSNEGPNASYVYHQLFDIEKNITSSISSTPRHINFCNKSSNPENGKQVLNMIVGIYPGQPFSIPVVLVGQLNGTIPGVVQTKCDTNNMKLVDGIHYVKSCNCTNLTYEIVVNSNNTQLPQPVQLSLTSQHSGDQSGYEKISNNNQTRLVNVTLQECPIGCTLNQTNGAFSCNYSRMDQTKCNMELDGPRIIIENSNAWIQFEYENNDDVPIRIHYSNQCLFGYCNNNKLFPLKKDRKNKYPRCTNNRANILCGGCADGYSAMLGSTKCGKCSNMYLVLLVAFGLAGVALVIVLTLINLTIFKGTLSGLIFYANIIECQSTLLVPSEHPRNLYLMVLKVFLGWLNLDLAIPTCFYSGMNAYAEAWLEFAFPIYIWLLSLLIIVFSNKFQWVAKFASENAVKVLATLVLLSYARFLHALISNFSFTYHMTINSTDAYKNDSLWLIDANIKYFGLRHSVLFGASMLFGLLSLPFTVILLFIKPLLHMSHKKPFKWVVMLKPFLDVYTGPYTDSGRFWPGMLLVARIVLSISGGWNSLHQTNTIIGVTLLVLVFLLAIAGMVRPGLYTTKALDTLEYFFLINLSLLHLGKGYFKDNDKHYTIVFSVLVSLAFFVFIGIVLYHMWLQIQRFEFGLNITNGMVQKVKNTVNFSRKDQQNRTLENYPPYVQFIHQREPLLADHEE